MMMMWWCDDVMMMMMVMMMVMMMMMMWWWAWWWSWWWSWWWRWWWWWWWWWCDDVMMIMMMMFIMMMTVQTKQVVFWNDDDAFSHAGCAKILFRYSGVLIFYSHHGHFYHGRETIVNHVVASVIASQQQRSMTQLSFVVRHQSKGQPFLFSSCDLFGWWHIGHMTAWPWIAH